MAEKLITYPHVLDNNQLENPDRSGQSYRGENILGLGFTRRTGLGYVMGVEYAKLGAEVVIGGSSPASVELARVNFTRWDGVDTNLLSGFPADLRDSSQIDQAVASLKKPPSILVYASALGMEKFFLPMSEYLQEMAVIQDSGDPNAEAALVAKETELREQLEIWVPEGYQDARAVNRVAPEYLIGRLVDRFGVPFKFIYTNSSFGKKGKGPFHYKNVYETKKEMSNWMSNHVERLASLGVDMHEETDPVLDDSDTGIEILENISRFWSKPIQKVVDGTKVSRLEAYGSIKLFTDMTAVQRTERPRLNEHFLLKRAGLATVLDQFAEELDIEGEEFNF